MASGVCLYMSSAHAQFSFKSKSIVRTKLHTIWIDRWSRGPSGSTDTLYSATGSGRRKRLHRLRFHRQRRLARRVPSSIRGRQFRNRRAHEGDRQQHEEEIFVCGIVKTKVGAWKWKSGKLITRLGSDDLSSSDDDKCCVPQIIVVFGIAVLELMQ